MNVRKIPKKTITIIEPKKSLIVDKEKHHQKRVAAYCRVSTDSDEQLTSYVTQKKVYTEMIAKNPEWEFAGLYADEGISGTRADKRPQFKQMIKDCLAGKIDIIITKSVSRFARNTVECLEYVRMLKARGIGIYFEEQNADIIILETGLGGRLDATNVIDAPKVAVITEIGKDHMEYLGDTFEKIAEEKAGIIKAGSYVVYSGNRQETAKVIERKAEELGVLCKCVEKSEKQDYRFVDKEIDFSFFSRYYGCIPIKLNTCAIYQIENAKIALTAIEGLGLEISKESMQIGMEKCRWEGRMEEILPGIYLDGAHNEDGIDAFIATVKQKKCNGKRWLLFSAVADKEYKIMKEKLIKSGLFYYIYASPLKNSRTISKRDIADIFDDKKVRIADSAYEGLQEIISLKNEEDFIYVTGSLYLVGEIKECLF